MAKAKQDSFDFAASPRQKGKMSRGSAEASIAELGCELPSFSLTHGSRIPEERTASVGKRSPSVLDLALGPSALTITPYSQSSELRFRIPHVALQQNENRAHTCKCSVLRHVLAMNSVKSLGRGLNCTIQEPLMEWHLYRFPVPSRWPSTIQMGCALTFSACLPLCPSHLLPR